MDAYNNVGIDSIETAKNLKKLRIENNLKLKQVRDAIGLSAEQTVCSWESKTHPKLPSIDNALNLARLYGVRLDQLYKTRPVKTGSPEKVDQEIRDRITISMQMGEFEEFFDDMRMERESICGPFVAAEAQREDGTWEPETISLPDELTYFSYDLFKLKLCKKKGSSKAQFYPGTGCFVITPEGLEDEKLVLHNMIHLHEWVLNQVPGHYKEMVTKSLYQELRKSISNLDERIEENLSFFRESQTDCDEHDTLFFLKSLDLDRKRGYELGTIYGSK